jgi:hypothetical protein
VLTWQNRPRDLFGRWESRWRAVRISNAYVFRDPEQRPAGVPAWVPKSARTAETARHAVHTATPRHSNYRSSDRGTDCRRSGAPAAVQEPFPDATWRGRASDSEFSGNQRRHRLPYPVPCTNRAAVAVRANRILTMRAYVTATVMALGLLAVWAAVAPFVA